MGKLVRDRIPDLIRADGRTPRVRTLNRAELRTALYAKLAEDVDELRAAAGRDAVIEEAADILAVLTAIVGEYDADLDGIIDAARATRTHRGGFDMRLWLDGVEP
jgi:predicted house-cleaning noncanonical NTP pyrophosphatase (MazG superfamily)